MQSSQAARPLKTKSNSARGPRRCIHRQHRLAFRAGDVDRPVFSSQDQARGVISRGLRNGPDHIGHQARRSRITSALAPLTPVS
jgi:hypothetical protein